MLRSAQICKKCPIFGNLRTITQEEKKETRQMTPFLSSTFWVLTLYDIYFYIWKMSKFVIIGFPLWSILVCKIPEFWKWKLWYQNFVPFNSGDIHIKESKEPGFIFFNRVENQICLISWSIIDIVEEILNFNKQQKR